MKRKQLGYGILSIEHLNMCAVAVCEVFGRRPNDVHLLLGTCAVETKLGQYRDKSIYRHGVGCMQIDEVAFDHIKEKYSIKSIAKTLRQHFGIALEKVEYRELAVNPLLSMIFARFQYWQVVEKVPENLMGMAQYWKDHYNTEAGKGEAADFVESYYHCELDCYLDKRVR